MFWFSSSSILLTLSLCMLHFSYDMHTIRVIIQNCIDITTFNSLQFMHIFYTQSSSIYLSGCLSNWLTDCKQTALISCATVLIADITINQAFIVMIRLKCRKFIVKNVPPFNRNKYWCNQSKWNRYTTHTHTHLHAYEYVQSTSDPYNLYSTKVVYAFFSLSRGFYAAKNTILCRNCNIHPHEVAHSIEHSKHTL